MTMRIYPQPRRHAVPWLVAAAVSALALGGLGGSLQLSRVLCAALIPVAFQRLFNMQIRSRFQSEILVFSVVLAMVSIVSIVWSIDRTVTLQYLVVLGLNMTPLLMTGLLLPEEITELRRLLPRAWLLAGAVMVPLALFELATGTHFVQGFDERGGGGIVDLLPFASGLHGNYNDFSLFLVLCVLGACFEINDPDTGRGAKVGKFIVVALIAMIVLINSSRGAIIGLAALMIARYLPLLPKRYLVMLLLATPFIAVLIFGAADDESLLLAYLKLKFSDFSGDLEAGDGRLGIFMAGVKGFLSTYGLGVGAGASSSYLATDPSISIPNAHNLFLEWGLNFGFVGVCIFVWLLFRLWLVSLKGEHRKTISVAILILPVLGVIQSHLTGYTYFWLMLATLSVFALEVPPRSSPAQVFNSVRDNGNMKDKEG